MHFEESVATSPCDSIRTVFVGRRAQRGRCILSRLVTAVLVTTLAAILATVGWGQRCVLFESLRIEACVQGGLLAREVGAIEGASKCGERHEKKRRDTHP